MKSKMLINESGWNFRKMLQLVDVTQRGQLNFVWNSAHSGHRRFKRGEMVNNFTECKKWGGGFELAI